MLKILTVAAGSLVTSVNMWKLTFFCKFPAYLDVCVWFYDLCTDR
jgi:hypothetical protein